MISAQWEMHVCKHSANLMEFCIVYQMLVGTNFSGQYVVGIYFSNLIAFLFQICCL